MLSKQIRMYCTAEVVEIAEKNFLYTSASSAVKIK
jgi:hypothetical protein